MQISVQNLCDELAGTDASNLYFFLFARFESEISNVNRNGQCWEQR